MSFEKVHYKGKEVKRDTDAIVGKIDPNIIWFINLKAMYLPKTIRPKKVVDKKNKV